MKVKEVIKIINTDKMSASNHTTAMKTIGNGNMQDGVKRVFEYGNIIGIVEGMIISLVGIPVVKKSYKFIKEQYNKFVDIKVTNYIEKYNLNEKEYEMSE